MKSGRYSTVLCMMLCLLAACESMVEIKPTITLVVESLTTHTPLPTATNRPTRSPTPNPTFTPTLNPTWVAILSTESFLSNQTQIARQSLNDSFFKSDYCYSILVSPNGTKLSCATEGKIIIGNDTHQSQTTISQKDILPNSSADIILSPFQWSSDNASLYFTASSCCKDGPGFLSGHVHNGLWRLNTSNNIITSIIKDPDDFNSPYYFSISPTDRQLVYINQFEEPLIIKIQDLRDSTIQQIAIAGKFNGAGHILWSTNGAQFVFVGISGDDAPFTPDARTSLMWVDIKSLETRELISDTSFMLTPERWESNNTIVIRSEMGTDYVPTNGSYWHYDLNEY